ncbi:anti-sigma F factor [Aedoeadaptatus ivorii]|uniref:Anti-sigma F factor n=1 Tax=Aedoeadaptatus ivorii TaxID=54006 RepID=A0A3S5BWF5_9FIRM|nr:ATP-binding protein [Peptoniphilus ivorii]MDQ0508890.1 serine/threonine-protein kinase RsbW [Peptoniphilus ivorii]VEJ35991.1 anti-sigma F factor [Peptoniphilus ivorii]
MKELRTIEGSVESDMLSLRGFIAEAMRQVSFYISDIDLQYDIRLIIDELLLNGAQHGNDWDSDKKVYLLVELGPETVSIVVRDEGRGIDTVREAFDCSSTRCNGRGLFLVESICESVRYEGNTIRCHMNI